MDDTSNVPFTMPVQPYGGGYGNNGGFGFGGDWAWILLLLLIGGNGWGMGGFGGGAWPMMMGMDGGFARGHHSVPGSVLWPAGYRKSCLDADGRAEPCGT